MLLHFEGFGNRVGDARAGRLKTDLVHGLLEALAVFGLVDRIGTSADEFNAVLFENAFAIEIHGQVESRLAAHGGQNSVWAFLFNDAGHHLPVHGLDVGGIGHLRVGHDGGRVGVDQHHAVPLFLKGLAGLGTGIVELAGLSDDDRTGPENHDGLNVCTFGHDVCPAQ